MLSKKFNLKLVVANTGHSWSVLALVAFMQLVFDLLKIIKYARVSTFI